MQTSSQVVVFLLALLSYTSIVSKSDFAADYNECSDQLIGLAMCLPYVQGDAKSPTPDCCHGYKQVTAKSVKCVCILIKDRNDPGLGLTVNLDSAIQLPSKCHSSFNASTCNSLLKLPPNSKAAKEFLQFEKILQGKDTDGHGPRVVSSSSNTSANATAIPSSGRRDCLINNTTSFCAMFTLPLFLFLFFAL